jgi:hypothetical protein
MRSTCRLIGRENLHPSGAVPKPGCYHSAIPWTRKAIAAFLAFAVLVTAALAVLAAPSSAAARPSIDAYRGSGAWIDIFDGPVLVNPAGTVATLALHDVRTIYVETANFTTPRFGSIAYPLALGPLIDAAHASGIKVVAWYLPGFKNLRRDLRRSLAAIRFKSVAGGRFDSFALDIESSAVRSIARRNHRAGLLSRRIRRKVGRHYPLGAIVPDQRSTSVSLPSVWPHFPYRRLRPRYDVFLPMTYSSARGRGAQFVYLYTRANIEYLRAATKDAALPVHVIGGLANKLTAGEDDAVVQAAGDTGALGASFYDLRLSDAGEWDALGAGFPPEYDPG